MNPLANHGIAESWQDALTALPQQQHTAKRATQWLSELQAAYERGQGGGLSLERHIERLHGFGGSDIGFLVAEQRGVYSPFGTAREIVAQKLLLQSPLMGDDPAALGHSQRGTDLEPIIRHHFHSALNVDTHSQALKQVIGHRHREHPWMQATPDDIVRLGEHMVLIDYKSPFEPLRDVSLGYGCQLHQGRLVAEDAGIKIDRMVLVSWNLRSWEPETFIIEHDPSLDTDIRQAGDHFWNQFVLRGQLPDWPQRAASTQNLAELPAEKQAQLHAAGMAYVRADILAKEAKRLAEHARDKLQQLAQTHAIADNTTVADTPARLKQDQQWDEAAIKARLSPDQIDVLSDPQWDSEHLVDLLRHHGGDPKAALVSSRFNLRKAADFLIEQQQIPSELLTTTVVKASVSRRKADDAVLASIKDQATQQSHQFALPGTSP